MDDLTSLYLRRKAGEGMGKRYVLSSLSPALLLFLVTAVMSFALTFISSISETIDRMIQVLGSGTLLCQTMPDQALFPEGTQIDGVVTGEGLAYSLEGECAVILKGVGDGYFNGLRGDELSLEVSDEDMLNPAVLSSSLAERLSLEEGERFTLLLYEEDKGRTRPLLCSVKGIFKAVYPQLDSHLVYVPSALLSGKEGYEVLLPKGYDAVDAALVDGRSYKSLYRALYSNLQSSVSVLYVIFLMVSLLAAFFSSDIAEAYIARDRKDIAHLLLLGLDVRKLEGIYFRLTLLSSTAAGILGTVLGIALSMLTPFWLSFIEDSPVLEYYVLSFSPDVPWSGIALMLLSMFLLSSLAVKLKLRHSKLADIFLL